MNKIKNYLPDALAVVLFIAIGFLYFFQPVTEGLVLTGHDHSGGIGAGVEMQEYQKRTGERTRWTNALFSGMPTYQMAPSYDSIDTLVGLQKIYQLGMTGVVMYVFVMLLGFYILLRAFDFKVWMAALGAVLWAFSSYFFIIIGAGHLWKVMALAYIPPTIAGLVLCYRGKYLWGGVVTAFFLALQIMSNHVQMSYYFLPVMGLMALAYLIRAVKEKKLAGWCKATGMLIVAGLIGVSINSSNLYHTYQYSKESMRGKSELTYKNKQNPGNQTKDGLERNLTPAEMLDQIYRIQSLTGERVSNIVIMGSGEPMDNYDNVIRFIRMITDENGLNISQRNITLSTCGIVPGILKLAEEDVQITLALSLHAPNDEVRKTLMPIANRYALKDILAACQTYFEKTGRRLTFEYSLVSGVNDNLDEAKALTALIKHMHGHVNLIPVNPIKERDYRQSDRKAIEAFKAYLEKNGINVTVRREMGRDINGACGQLRKSFLEEEGKGGI